MMFIRATRFVAVSLLFLVGCSEPSNNKRTGSSISPVVSPSNIPADQPDPDKKAQYCFGAYERTVYKFYEVQ